MKKNMISKTFTALVLVALTALFSNCSTEDNAVERSYDVQILGVKDNAASLELGQTLKLIVSPHDIGLVWKSSDERVATVTENGLVTAVGIGEAIVTLYSDEYDGMTDGKYVTVKVADVSFALVDDEIDQAEAE